MRFLSVRDLRGKPGEAWRSLEQEREVVVTSNGKPIAILSAVNESSLEETLAAIRRARAVSAVTESQRRASGLGTAELTLAEINHEISAVRRQRRARD